MLPNDVTIMTVENSQLQASQSASLTDSSSSNGSSVNANNSAESSAKSENGISNETNLTSVELATAQNGNAVQVPLVPDKLHADEQIDERQAIFLDERQVNEANCMADPVVNSNDMANNATVAATGERLPFTGYESSEVDPEAEDHGIQNEESLAVGTSPNADEVSALNVNTDTWNGNAEYPDTDRNSFSNVNADRIECVVAPGVPPDGGYGWVIVAACITQNMIVDGVCFSFGAQIEPLRRTFADSGVRTQQLALVGSLVIGLYLFLGPFCGLLANRFGCRAVTVCGSLIASAAFVLTWATCPQGCVPQHNATTQFVGSSNRLGYQPSSFSPYTSSSGVSDAPACTCSVDALVITYGLVGIGFSMLYVPAIMIIGCYFERRRMLASGIAVVGSGVGITFGAPLIRFIIVQIGGDWYRAQLVVAGIVLLCALAGACFRPLPSRIQEPPSYDDHEYSEDADCDRCHDTSDFDQESDAYGLMQNGRGRDRHVCSGKCREHAEQQLHDEDDYASRGRASRRAQGNGNVDKSYTCDYNGTAGHRVIVIKRSHIMQKIIEDKQRQRTVSNGSLDNCLITTKNEVIKAPPSDDTRRTQSQHRQSSLISDSLSQRLCSLLSGSTRAVRNSTGLLFGLGSRAKITSNVNAAANTSVAVNLPSSGSATATVTEATPVCNGNGALASAAVPPTLVFSTPSRRASSTAATTASGTPQRIVMLANAANRSVPTSRQVSPGSSMLSVHSIGPSGANCAAPSPSRTTANIGRILAPPNTTTSQYQSIKTAMITQAMRELDKPLRRDMFLNSRARLPSVSNVNETATAATVTVTDSGCLTLNTATNQQLTVIVTQPAAAATATRSNQHSPSPAALKHSISSQQQQQQQSRPIASEIYARGAAVPSQTICILSEDSIPQRRDHSMALHERLTDIARVVHFNLRDTIDVALLRRSWMCLLVVSSTLTSIGFFVPFMFVVDAAGRLDKIVSLRASLNPVYLLSIIGLANTVGRVCTVFGMNAGQRLAVLMTSVPWLDCFIINIVALLLAGVATIAIPFCQSLEALIVCVCGYGICIAVYVALQSSVILELLGDRNVYRLNGALGVVLLVEGISMIVGCCVAGYYFDTTGNYRQSFMFAGIVIFISGCLCMPLRHLAKRGRDRKFHRAQVRTRSRSPAAHRHSDDEHEYKPAMHDRETSSEHDDELHETSFAATRQQDLVVGRQVEPVVSDECDASNEASVEHGILPSASGAGDATYVASEQVDDAGDAERQRLANAQQEQQIDFHASTRSLGFAVNEG